MSHTANTRRAYRRGYADGRLARNSAARGELPRGLANKLAYWDGFLRGDRAKIYGTYEGYLA